MSSNSLKRKVEMTMFHRLKNNNRTYWINLNHIAFIEEKSENREANINFVSGQCIPVEDFSEYQKLLRAIERREL